MQEKRDGTLYMLQKINYGYKVQVMQINLLVALITILQLKLHK